MLEEDRPCADRFRIRRVLGIHHSPTCGAKGSADAINIGNDRPGHRHFHHLSVVHETVLQIDDDVRGLLRTQGIEHRDVITAET